MKNILFCLVFFFSLLLSAQEKWSLEECIDYAREHNIEIQKQQFQNKITNEDITIAKGNYFPDANFFCIARL